MTAASPSRRFPPNQACLREGEAQRFTDHPHLPLRAWVSSSLPLPSHFLIPWASQPPGCRTLAYYKNRKINLSTCLSFWFCKRCTLPPSRPPCIHSFLILHSLPLVLSPFLHPGLSRSLAPHPSIADLMVFLSHSQPISGPWFWGSSWVVSHFRPGISKAPFVPS